MYPWRHFLDTINALITGDNDLLDARSAVTTRIVTVAEFAAEFGIS
jgi:predicted nucleic acid-binding protein